MRNRPLALKTWVVLVVVAPLLLISLVLLTLTALSTRRVAESMGDAILRNSSNRVRLVIADYLQRSVRVSDRYAESVLAGELPVSALEAWQQQMWQDMRVQPEIASICFANPSGETVWLLRDGRELQYGYVDRVGAAQILSCVDRAGRPFNGQPATPYDATGRDWYKLALQSGKPEWTSIYPWYGDANAQADATMGSGYTRALYKDGKLLGVLVVDVTLASVSERLSELPLVQINLGHAVVVDDLDLLVANSLGKPNAPGGKRIALHELGDPIGPLLAEGTRRSAEPRVQLSNGDYGRGKVEALDIPGVKWRLITVLPEAAFLREANHHRNGAIIFGAVVLVLAAVLGLKVAKRVATPLLELSGFARRVGAGDFSAQIHLKQARELKELSDELNRMSAGLQQRMELEHSLRLATEVQQSLLPRTTPSIPGLDIAGRSRYCDETGGDYFDFIDVVPVDKGQVLIAVGDVTGHGIASALLMATARAAVRVSAAEHGDLARIMTNVNEVLARDEHGRFMTLCLMILDPASLTVRYASAGHDAPMIYYPNDDRFHELGDGGVPLGALPGVAFEEYRYDGLRVGNLIVIGTDGIWEARNAADEMFGKDRLRELMRRHANDDAGAVALAIDQAVDGFRGARRVLDDITFVVLRIVDQPVGITPAQPSIHHAAATIAD